MGNPNGPHHGGVNPVKIALRDALRVYIYMHLTKHPLTEFTAVDLARVIHQQYIGGPTPPSLSGYRYGRSNVVMSVLAELEDRGEVTHRDDVHRGVACKVWRIVWPA